jgi:hypothetical protein
MWHWARLFWLLAALGGAGLLVVHYQTSVVTTGYRITTRLDEREALREENRRLRIELGRAGVPRQIQESWKLLSKPEEDEKESRPAPGEAPESGTDREGN